MPYANIHWIKLEKRLLNDYRFYTLSEESQLIFLKLLMLAAETNNKIPKNNGVIKNALRSKQSETKIEECINEIKINFPKFKENKGFYFFREWSNRCNWIAKKEHQWNSEGTPKDAVDKNRIDKIRIDKIIKEYITLQGWDKELKEKQSLLTEIYKRNCAPAKRLILAANNDELVIKVMRQMGSFYKQKGLSWTLETVLKHFPEFIKDKTSIENFIKE